MGKRWRILQEIWRHIMNALHRHTWDSLHGHVILRFSLTSIVLFRTRHSATSTMFSVDDIPS